MKSLRRNRRKLHKDDRGSAMAMVIVIITFIAILAAILMFISYVGYQMRLLDRSGKDNFYTAETVLDEINVGLQVEVSDAIAEAYEDVMSNYALYDSAQARSNQFYDLYVAKLREALKKNPSGSDEPDGRYSVERLRNYLSPEVKGDGEDGSGGDGSRDRFGTFGAIVESNLSPESYMLVTVKGEGVLLKDLKVTYVDERGYVSIISTDIRIVLPNISFTQASDLPNINEYCLIADETLAMGNGVAGGGVTVKGNAYAGRMTIGRHMDSDIPTMLTGSKVTFENVNGTTADTRSLVIAREDIHVNESTFQTKGVQLWGSNLVLDSSDTKLDGSTNLKKDLVLEGTGSKATLVGEYNGFGMAGTSAASGTSNPSTSTPEEGENAKDTMPALNSAILVNGRDSTLDLSGLETMSIAGHAYVKTAVKSNVTADVTNDVIGETTALDTENRKNVMMGESVAVKSNQLIYLAPAEAVGCMISKTGAVEESVYGCNPLTLEQYEEIVGNPDKYVLLDGSRQIAALGYKSLNSYISQETLVNQTAAYVPEIIFRQTNAGPLVYCYLKFTDEEKANQYFRDYYDVNEEKVNQYMQLYAKEIKMPDPYSMLYLNLAGNMLVADGTPGEAAWVLPATDSYADRKQSQNMSVSKSIVHSALSAKIVTNVSQLSVSEMEHTAFENIIDDSKVHELLDAYSPGTSTVKISSNEDNPTAANAKAAIITAGDYVIDAATPSDVHMIISLGSVEVRKNFEGLIIAGNNVAVVSGGGNQELTPLSMEDFSEIMNASIHIGDEEYRVLDVFRDGAGYSVDENGFGIQSEKVMLADLIIYERWSKR